MSEQQHKAGPVKVSISQEPAPACDAFVRQQPEGRAAHLPAWGQMVTRVFAHKTFYLVAHEGDDVSGILPLTHVRSRLFGNRMVSQAFSNYGGPLAGSSDARKALYDRAVELAMEHGCESIEFRNVQPLPYDLQSREGKMVMCLPLPDEAEELWGGFKAKVRNQVRKGEKSGIRTASGGQELLDEFYRVYTIRMHELGTPGYSRKLMQGILETFPQDSRIFLVRLGELTVGAAFTTCFNGFVEIPWAATRVEYNNLCPNVLLYWTVLKHYCTAGASRFDFGRCTVGSSTHRFKKQWGSEPVTLHYQYWVRAGRELDIQSPDNPKYRRRIELWKKLPLWASRLLGPKISRGLP